MGDRLKRGEKEYRVIYLSDDYLILCELGSKKLKLTMESLGKILDDYADNRILIVDEPQQVVDIQNMSDSDRQLFEKKKEAIGKIVDEYGPDFMDISSKKHKQLLYDIAGELNVSYKTVLRMIIKYVQSGLRDYSLLPYTRNATEQQTRYSSVKLGRPSEEEQGVPASLMLHEQFDDAIAYYKNEKECSSWEDAYNYLKRKYYRKKITDENGRARYVDIYPQPTIRQLRYYANKILTGKDVEIIKTSEMEYNNDKRVLIASAETGVYAPFDLVEADAVEFDVSLVDVDHYYLTVGRPIIYLMKDVLTRMIVAASIGFDNNSTVALVSCFANLNEDKIKLFAQYGITVDNELYWLTGYKPRRVRFDNGSDFISKHIEHVCKALNIQRDTVRPGTGSYKGVIERSFHDAHQKLNKFLALLTH